MKVIKSQMVIENQEFVLIKDEQNGQKYWGTISYSEIDENGRMKRALNGLEMKVSFVNAQDAVNRRRDDMILSRFIEKYEKEGTTKMDAVLAALADPEYQALCK